MLHLKPCSAKTIHTESSILNSQPQYLEIAYKCRLLSEIDIVEQHQESQLYKTKRFIVLELHKPIAIVEYGFSSPRQQLPWINLLCIDAKFTRCGYAKKVLQLVEQNMYKEGARTVLLAVHKQNDTALKFWAAAGFTAFEERTVQGDELISFQKILTNQSV